MALISGTRLGPYEILSALGAGGMGEVYRATDTKLKRQVAVKILPPSLAADPDRLARFQREAEVLASLNHPNIAAIYGLEEADGVKALVMELVEGPTLADRIAQGPIPIDEALPIAKQIAEALEAAHEQGIIHRDLKPANIKVRPDGTVKVLDFGLAKAMEPASATRANAMNSPTLSIHATQAGMILGTASYMAPGTGGWQDRRQARGSLGLWRRRDGDADGPSRVYGRDGVARARGRAASGAGLERVARRHARVDPAIVAALSREGSQATPRFGRRRATGDRGGIDAADGWRRRHESQTPNPESRPGWREAAGRRRRQLSPQLPS